MQQGFESRIVSRDEMLVERLALLEKEKEVTKLQEEVNALRRRLPWVEVKEDYLFQGAEGPVRLSQLFRNDKDNLIVQHVMFEPDKDKACSVCSCWVDGVNGFLPQLESKAHYVIVCRAPYDKVAKFVKAKNWKCEALSSSDCNFNHDYGVEFTADEIANKNGVYNFNRTNIFPGSQYPGVSVFRKYNGRVYCTYSVYARGLERLNSIWAWLDLLPDGRCLEDGSGSADGHGGKSWQPKHAEEYSSGGACCCSTKKD